MNGGRADRVAWLGLDVGTSSAKALLVDGEGRVLGRGTHPIATSSSAPGIAEQDPDDYVRAAASATRAALRTAAPGTSIVGIGLSGQTPTLVLVDGAGTPVRPAMTWQDVRADPQALELRDRFGDPFPVVGTSLPWAGTAVPAKLAWLARYEPDSVARTRVALQPKDYVGLMLTGSPLSDPWSSKGLCHVLTREPAHEVLRAAGWPESVVPPLADGWATRGDVTHDGAVLFQVDLVGAPVSVGLSDAMSGMLALGALTSPTAFAMSGTSSIAGVSAPTAPPTAHPLYVIPRTCSPLPVVYGPTQASGASVDWIARALRLPLEDAIDLAAAARGSTPTFLPYIAGERAPIWDSQVRGVMADLDIAHGPGDLVRGVMVGVALSERHVIDTAAHALVVRPPAVDLGGHAARDPRWHPIRLETMGARLRLHDDDDPASRGAAMLAYAQEQATLAQAVSRLGAPIRELDQNLAQEQLARRRFDAYLGWSGLVTGHAAQLL